VAKPARKQTSILISAGELRGGTRDEDGKRLTSLVLADGEELTAEKQQALGLTDSDVEDLVDRGKLIAILARTAEVDGADEIAAAEAKIAELEKQVADLTAENAALKAAAAQQKG
jgi:polyhydroxyalkanoate synthesis regulator phasin